MFCIVFICNIIEIKHVCYKNDIKMIFWDEKEAKIFLEELPFYNVCIEKPSIRRLNNIDFLCELPFYDELML